MPYRLETTAQNPILRSHLFTPTILTDIVCSLCDQRCSHHHVLVQISGAKECQCIFGLSCIAEWLLSKHTRGDRCPNRKTILYKIRDLPSDGNNTDNHTILYSSKDGNQTADIRRGRTREKKALQRFDREGAPSPESTDERRYVS
ncbi:hypothetical protein GQ44DRAFT_402511 [Phaeosphaeriaceae sp. PMI808]|nr:hypothetical protein GQ44DRAFT_402511 [Phaeosphaeriaceae sp. PMI808]